MSWKHAIPLFVFAAIAGMLALGLRNDPTVVPSPLIQRAMPAFTAERLHEPALTVGEADWTGRKALVNVWASWCVACREEHDLLLALRDAGVVVYGLNYKDKREDALDWLARHGDPYAMSARDPDGKIGIDWGVYGVPETFVIDERGVIQYKHIGVLKPEDLERHILPLLADEGDGDA